MPTFFPAVKSARGGQLPMPRGVGSGIWWGDGRGPIYAGVGLNTGGQVNYAVAAGDVSQNSAVSACLNWIGTNWGAAPVQVGREDGDGKFEPVKGHPLVDLLTQPHEDYTGKWLIWALVTDYYGLGNGYAHIVMAGGRPSEVEYLPARCVSPVPDPAGRLLRYAYKPDQTVIPVEPADVAHFRFGIDPGNTLQGRPPLAPVYHEIVSDNCAGQYAANLLFHGGLPPAILIPDPAGQSAAAPLDPQTAKALKDAFNEKRRINPGEIQMLTNALKLIELGWKPEEMALNDVREEPETRICAQFGIPPITVGLRAGLIRSTFANMEQAERQAWRGCLAPLQSYFASEWTRQLLPLFPDSEGMVVRYDHSQVSVLAEDMNAKREQARKDHGAGLITHEEARAESGRAPLTDKQKAEGHGQKGDGQDVTDGSGGPTGD
jgi:HK97 family phage portal protein